MECKIEKVEVYEVGTNDEYHWISDTRVNFFKEGPKGSIYSTPVAFIITVKEESEAAQAPAPAPAPTPTTPIPGDDHIVDENGIGGF